MCEEGQLFNMTVIFSCVCPRPYCLVLLCGFVLIDRSSKVEIAPWLSWSLKKLAVGVLPFSDGVFEFGHLILWCNCLSSLGVLRNSAWVWSLYSLWQGLWIWSTALERSGLEFLHAVTIIFIVAVTYHILLFCPSQLLPVLHVAIREGVDLDWCQGSRLITTLPGSLRS
jgi:hypothetical protein